MEKRLCIFSMRARILPMSNGDEKNNEMKSRIYHEL